MNDHGDEADDERVKVRRVYMLLDPPDERRTEEPSWLLGPYRVVEFTRDRILAMQTR